MGSTSRLNQVTLSVEKGGFLVARPSNLDHRKVGERFRVKSNDGKVRVVFDHWPFEGKKHAITDGRTRTFAKPGKFKFKCEVRGLHPAGGFYVYRKIRGSRGAHGSVDPPGRP